LDDVRQRRHRRLRRLVKGRVQVTLLATTATILLGGVVAGTGYTADNPVREPGTPLAHAVDSAGRLSAPPDDTSPAHGTAGPSGAATSTSSALPDPGAAGAASSPVTGRSAAAAPAPTGPAGGAGVSGPPGQGWRQVWGDEFDGTAVDSTKWVAGNGYRQQTTCHYPRNVSVSGGTAKLTVHLQKSDCGGDYSGSILWGTKKDIRYGYMEARIRYKLGPGMWGNFWTVGARKVNGKVRTIWPPEFDNGETTGNNPGRTLMAFHHSRKDGKVRAATTWVPLDTSTWHTYGVEFLPGQQVRQFIDGRLVHETHVKSPDVDQYIVLRMGGAAEPSWGGVPDATSEWPGIAEYDWVRVYQKG
jgi:beta-glucanase (GH16 family)